MRYLTVAVEPAENGAFHPLGGELADAPSIKRRAIHHVELLADGTGLLFAEASGSQERYKQIMEDSPHVRGYLTAGADRWMSVSHFEPTDAVRRALELQRESLLVVDTPIRFTSEGQLKITYLGTDEVFRDVYNYATEADYMSLDVLETGEYEVSGPPFSRLLTSRQEEVLEAAVDLGYYSEPRQASLAEIGDVVGITPGTVGEHLRKVEAQVFGELVR